MRLLVLYDLPVVSKSDKRAYARFHKFLLRNGYDMIQFSIYARLCNGQDALDKHVARLKANLPGDGSVRYMQVTEKQFVDMAVLVGNKTRKEDPVFAQQLSFF
jgi:CRISPR-associated protein Cas2